MWLRVLLLSPLPLSSNLSQSKLSFYTHTHSHVDHHHHRHHHFIASSRTFTFELPHLPNSCSNRSSSPGIELQIANREVNTEAEQDGGG